MVTVLYTSSIEEINQYSEKYNKKIWEFLHNNCCNFRKINYKIGDAVKESILAENLLKFALKNKGIKNFVIEKNFFGKPILKDYPNFNFNISHSKNCVMCACSNDEIGIDVQKIYDINYNRILKNFFSPEERNFVNYDCTCAEARKKFFKLWTMKESYSKMLGTSIFVGFSLFSAVNNNRIIMQTNIPNTKEICFFKSIDFLDDYLICVCQKKHKIDLIIKSVTPKDLLMKF